MVLAEGQISITRPDGAMLVLHHGTAYRVNEFEPFDRGVRPGKGGVIPWGDGEWAGAEFRAGSAIPLRVGIHAADWSSLMDLWWDLDAAFRPIGTDTRECELRFNAAGLEYLMYVRPRGATLRNRRGRTGRAWADAELYALDPAIYSGTEFVTEVGMYRLVGGVTVPFTTPFATASTVADGVVSLVNNGTAPARLDLTIPGPSVDPYITVTGPSGIPETLFFDLELGADDVLTVDTKTQNVTLNGSQSRLWAAFGDWPLLAPRSTSVLEYRSANESGPPMTIRHRWTY